MERQSIFQRKDFIRDNTLMQYHHYKKVNSSKGQQAYYIFLCLTTELQNA